MDTKTKKLIFFIGSLFVAIIFLSSYAAFGNNGNSSTTTSTIKQQQTFFSTGTSTATVINYSDVVNITLRSGVNKSAINMSGLLSQLQANGTIQNYIYSNGNYQVILYGVSAYNLQQLLYKDPVLNGNVDVGAATYVTLPKTVMLYYGGQQPINVYLNNRNYSVYLNNVQQKGSVINVSISALLTANGSIYNNQFRISMNSAAGTSINATRNASNTNTTTIVAANAISSNTTVTGNMTGTNTISASNTSNTANMNSLNTNSIALNSTVNSTNSSG